MADSNLICHWCRISKNRKCYKKVEYVPCPSCRKVYCERCIDRYPEINPSIDGCLHCRKLCCCTIKCEQDHKCCYNSKRSFKRRTEKEVVINNKRKFDQMENMPLSKLIEIAEPEFSTMNIYFPIPIRIIPILSQSKYKFRKEKKHVTWDL